LAGASVAVLAGAVGLYGSHYLGTAAGASVALALCGAAAAGMAGPRLTRGEARPGSRASG
ncbi:MAG: hypothetical protein M3131_06210, partial [Actinomycetota bacterium]|nr:hypothetical protein [Actinomycetota bacterium]